MPEMTSKEAAERINRQILDLKEKAEAARRLARRFGSDSQTAKEYDAEAAALRLAVGALEREARRMAAMPWRCQHCALLDASCFGSNEECNGFEEREHE